MSLNEQLLEDMASQFLNGEGILKLIEKIPKEEMNLFYKIKNMLEWKEKQYRSQRFLNEISSYIKIETEPTPFRELKANEVYIMLHISIYYLIWINQIKIIDNYPVIGGYTLNHKLLKHTYGFINIHNRYPSWNIHEFILYRVIDESLIEDVIKMKKMI